MAYVVEMQKMGYCTYVSERDGDDFEVSIELGSALRFDEVEEAQRVAQLVGGTVVGVSGQHGRENY